MRIVQGSSTEKIYFVAFSAALSTTRVSDHTTAGFTVRYIKDGSTVTANSAFSNPDGSSSPGVYALHLIDSTLTALPAGVDSRELCITISGSMETVTRTVELYRRTATTGQTLALNSSGKIADVESILTKVTSVDSRLSSMDTMLTSVNAKVSSVDSRLSSMDTMLSSVNAKVSSVDSRLSSMDTMLTSVNAKMTSVDTDIDTALTRLSSLGTHVDTILTRTSPNNIGAAVWDSQSTLYTAIGSFGQANYIRHAGSAQAGGSNTITLNSSASTVSNIYTGNVITLTSGTGAGQSRFITLNSTALVATVDSNWHTNPAAGTGYMIQPYPPSDIEASIDAIATDVNNIDTNVGTILSQVSSIEANTTSLVTKLTSVETDVDSVLTKVTSINAETTAIRAETTAIKAKTDSLTFTQAGNVDANIQYVNDVQVQGTGSTADTWRPV